MWGTGPEIWPQGPSPKQNQVTTADNAKGSSAIPNGVSAMKANYGDPPSSEKNGDAAEALS